MRRALAVLASAAVAGGCQPYERDVGGRTFFSGLEGAEVPAYSSARPEGYADPRALPPDLVREELDDGTVILRARSARHLMKHIYETLRDDELELFTEQVLSRATRDEFAQHGATAEEGFRFLQRHFEDIDKLFARMPMAEYAPNAIYEQIGAGAHRLRLVGGIGRELKWQGFDMVMEDGEQRLLWFYDADR
ncbi:MAG: hypothetical protein ACTS22_02045 [Phycisphaerales bacterium]